MAPALRQWIMRKRVAPALCNAIAVIGATSWASAKPLQAHAFIGTWQIVPNLNLTKVAFACQDLGALQRRIAARAADGEVRVATRMRPKRAAELVGGSLYWIVRHQLVACQQILRFEDREDGRIDIVCSSSLTTVSPRPRRAHQGWRYFEDDGSAPASDESGVAALPPQLYGRLAALALV